MAMPGVEARDTVATIWAPPVMSGSSPLSFSMAQETACVPIRISKTASSRGMPLGVVREMRSFRRPVSNIQAAALAAAAAQEPVVYPRRNRLPSFTI